MKAPRGVPALLLLFVCAGGVTAQEWTEAQVIEAFLDQSPHAREVKARVEAVRAETAGRTLLSNPSAVFSREGAGYASFYQIEQQLPWPGRRGLLKQAGMVAASVAEAEGAAALWTLRSELRAAFYRMAAAQRRERVLSDGLRDLADVIRVLRSRESEGEGSKYDRLRAERELAEYRSQLALAGTEIAQARSQLSAFLPPGTNVQRVATPADSALTPPGLDLLMPRALSHRFEFVSEQRQIERYRLEQRAAGRLRYPDPTVAFGMKRGDVAKGETETSSAVGITIPLPVFNKGQTEVARWSAELEVSTARRDAIERRFARK